MDKSLYWFLDSVLYTPYPIFWLGEPAENLGALINHEAHYLTSSEAAARLYHLSQQGDLMIFPYADPDAPADDAWEMTPIFPSEGEIETAIEHDCRLGYGLTAQGGRLWEQLARADWRRFISREGSVWGIPLWHFRSATSINQQLLEEYLAIQAYEWEEEIIPATVTWKTVRPWQATHWKELDDAVCVEFHVNPREIPQDPAWHRHRSAMLRQWSEKTQWHIPYRDMPQEITLP